MTFSSEQTYLSKVRSEVRTLPPYNSGLTGESVRTRYNVAQVAKLGSNENPWGTSAKVLAALAEAVAESALYPDPASDLLREALSKRLGVGPQRIALGNGSEDLISVCSHTFLSPGEEMVTITPAFGLHVLFPTAQGAHVRPVRVEADYGDHTADPDDHVQQPIEPARHVDQRGRPATAVERTP
jgi:histidinol-phosphate aminotransferase